VDEKKKIMLEVGNRFKYDRFSFWLDSKSIQNTIFVAVSGSHAFGWSTDKSDLDVRIAWIPNLAQAVSPFYKAKTEQFFLYGREIDVTQYPIQTFVSLLERGNGNCIENLFQFKLYHQPFLCSVLQRIIMDNLHQGILRHYLGYCNSLIRDLAVPARVLHYGRTKLLLNAYRCALLALAIEKDNIIVSNIRILAKKHYSDNQIFIDSLLKNNEEGERVEIDYSKVTREVFALRNELSTTLARSRLPKVGFSQVPLDRFVVSLYQNKEVEK